MRRLAGVMGAVLLSGCHQPGAMPTAPTPVQSPLALPVSIAPNVPPFSTSLTPAATPVYAGLVQMILTNSPTPGAVAPEAPRLATVICPSLTTTMGVGFGSAIITCAVPEPGEYTVRATVSAVSGFETTASSRFEVRRLRVAQLFIYANAIESTRTTTTMLFTTAEGVDGALGPVYRYLWDFDDGSTDRTLRPEVRHVFSGGSRERRIRVTAVDDDGETMATGSLAGRW